LLDALLDICRARKWRKARGRQRPDALHVLARVRAVNRLEGGGATLRYALTTRAVVAPEWGQAHCPAGWVQRYGHRGDDDHLPTNTHERHASAQTIGIDGHALLAARYAPSTPQWLRHVPAVATLRRGWGQQFYLEAGQMHWRTEQEGMPPAGRFLRAPYDAEARSAKKRPTSWGGETGHVTETCAAAAPHLITHVETPAGPVAAGEVTSRRPHALACKGVLPAAHIVETGYLDAELLVTRQRDYGINFLGPTRAHAPWPAHAAPGFAARSFAIAGAQRQARCPGGQRSASWTPTIDKRKKAVGQIQCSIKDCQPCPSRAPCPRAQRRMLTVRRQAHSQALPAARARETSPAYTIEYARRAGIAGTLSQGTRAYGLRRARYIGEVKTALQHMVTAAAMHCVRMGNWLRGKPLAQTRTSAVERVLRQWASCGAIRQQDHLSGQKISRVFTVRS
jgi:transposase